MLRGAWINRNRYLGLVLLCALVLAAVLGAPPSRARPNVTKVTLSGERIAEASPAVADFDGDGDKEIVAAGQDGMLYVVAREGSIWSVVWQRQTAADLNAAGAPNPQATTDIRSAPAVADLDGDGRLEIVVTTGGNVGLHKNGGVLVYAYDSSWSFSVVSGWPQPKLDIVGAGAGASYPDGYWDGIWGSAALGDLDGDGDLEVAVEGFDRRLHAWHHNGVAVDGWPITRDNGDALLRGGWSSPAMGDIDGDGLPEVIFGTDSPEWAGEGTVPDYSKATLWVVNGDSTSVPGFPVTTDLGIQSSPALGDIDDDGELEIVVGTGMGGSGEVGHHVYAWNGDGTSVANWPRPTADNMYGSPSLGDLDGDGDVEIVIGCGIGDGACQWLYAWHGDGTNVDGFPIKPPAFSPWSTFSQDPMYPPLLVDYDGDSVTEIMVVVRGSWGVTIVEPDGTINPDRSRVTGEGAASHGFIMAAPIVDDVDGDGLLETIVGSVDDSGAHGEITIWEETGSIDAARPWPTFHHDMQRTGNLWGIDTVPPDNPTVSSPSHTASTWSNDNTVQINWSGAVDKDTGIRGYYYAWDMAPATDLDKSANFVDDSVSSLTSDPLSDRDTHYFHLRAVDKAGNLADTPVHLGPFWIDTQPPASFATSPAFATGGVPVSWQGTDGGSGVAGYDVQARQGSGGSWMNWQDDVTITRATYDGTPGNTYVFRSRARDAAGNVETPPEAGDTQTTVTAYAFTGHVFNNREAPVFNAVVQPDPAMTGVVPSDFEGAYGLFFDDAGTYQLSVQRSGFGTLPPRTVSGGSQSGLDFYLPPATDLIVDGNFELASGTLAGSAWAFQGSATLTDVAHTGSQALVMSGAGTVTVSQTLSVPGDWIGDGATVSWMGALAAAAEAQDALTVEVLVNGQSFDRTVSLADWAVDAWTHGYLDVNAGAGQTVVVRLTLEAASATSLRLDEISLGETEPGIHKVYLPGLFRAWTP